MTEQIVQVGVGTGAALTAGYTLKTVLGPTLSLLGEDISKLYAAGRDRIIEKAMGKGITEGDGKASNPRITQEVFRSGCLADSEICAEYFGGILASSRTADGKDDSALPFLDEVKRLSSKQLHLHYVIYSSLNKLVVKPEARKLSVSRDEFQSHRVVFSVWELVLMGLVPATDAAVLHRSGLIHAYDIRAKTTEDKLDARGYASFQPTTFGVMLFAASTGDLVRYLNFANEQFADYNKVPLPLQFYSDINEAQEKMLPMSVPEKV
ncbi:hypothetical protein [Brevifollis gellanilyticus]|uniref:DUF4393 domain-containing protein n=1 Tax=Brevifollis gellanilyticus TaxID=748831 RepID=A0A512MH27_9BACT|nr:hypothetical protein [Brevifollis gellanilyticus]GEP46029.1 hypothetical protein BGE01nite_53200 [Brevifollis gellanilyticus]